MPRLLLLLATVMLGISLALSPLGDDGGGNILFAPLSLFGNAPESQPAPVELALLGLPVWLILLVVGLPLAIYSAYRLIGSGDNKDEEAKPAYITEENIKEHKAEPVAVIPGDSFADVAGCDEAVEEVRELVAFLKNPEPFLRLGAKMPSGVILHGPPGTGKTLIARALAGEAGVPFFAASGSEFIEMYVGVGASRIRSLFSSARKCPEGAVMFIDEIDTVGAKRSRAGSAADREGDQTLNQLLSEMDGFAVNQRLVVIGATNRLDVLDEALTRPGRFSRQVEVQLPDKAGRRAILEVHSEGRPLAGDVDLDSLAEMTAGVSGAELAETINEGAIWAARQGKAEIGNDDLFEGLCRVIAGAKKKTLPEDEDQLNTVAIHEAGHALVGELCPSLDKTQHLTIQPRGRALGFALQGQSDRALVSEQELHEKLMMILGGRAGEYVALGAVSSGAAGDLIQASTIARRAIEEWGLGKIGQISGPLSEATRGQADEEVSRLVDEAYSDAVELLLAHQNELFTLRDALLEHETLTRADLDNLLGNVEEVAHHPAQSHRPSKKKTKQND